MNKRILITFEFEFEFERGIINYKSIKMWQKLKYKINLKLFLKSFHLRVNE